MLFFITLLFACQLIGEICVAATGIKIPGPVLGMVILFIGLLINKGIPEELAKVGDALLSNLTLLFVPAGVGIMIHAHLIATDLLPISISILLSTVLTIIITGALMNWLGKKSSKTTSQTDGEAQ